VSELPEFTSRYGESLAEYVSGAGESALQNAYEIGRSAIAQGLGLMDLAVAHRTAITARLAQLEPGEQPSVVVARATEFLENCLAPFEMVQRGFHEANTRLEAANALLARRGEELADLNRELEARNRELERATRQREQLTALVVHDLKSPLSGVVLNARVLSRMPGADESVRSAAQNIATASLSMQRMVMDILDISRSEEASLVLKPERIELDPLLQRVAQELTSRADAAGQSIRVSTKPENTSLVCDAELLRRVLVNLVDNGLRHSPRSTSVEIEAHAAGDRVEIAVSDHGTGIPADLRTRIFDPYVQLESGRARGGHGLGLAFCRVAVEAHGGTVSVEEARNGGARFVVRLPQTPLTPGGSLVPG
jgi:signal transduction histidine kinase